MRLQNTVALHSDETAASFASRLAMANGIPTIAELLMDAEHSMAGFLKGDQKTFITLAALGGVTLNDLSQHEFFDTWSLWLPEVGEGSLDQPVPGRS